MRIAPALFLAAALGAACFPQLSKVHLSACINECNGASSACLGVDGSGGGKPLQCSEADACFDKVQACSDSATKCSDDCAHGDTECLSGCSHQANECVHAIRACVDRVKDCAGSAGDGDKRCLTDLVSCVAGCASDVEALLRGSK